MIRKISQKALFAEEKAHRAETRVEQNEYYLPHPNVKASKTANKESEDR